MLSASRPPLGDVKVGARRAVASAAYLAFARHLPWSPRPGGAAAKRLRGLLAQSMLDHCGQDVNIEHGAWFGSGQGVSVGDRSAIGMDALVIGPLQIGNDVMMGPRCILLSSSHDVAETGLPMSQQGFAPDRPIVIEDDVWIGAGVVILPGRRIGRGSIVGAGAVVAHDVPDYAVVAGNPAQVVKYRVPQDQTEGAS
ncbi:CatB-related O-acetyltransferase [Acidothermaceae bacterium B102]|nr:CatB-related O-acetyltransferase [Acidothermaceae bacterium B102]